MPDKRKVGERETKPWWQWILLYPTAAVALFTAFPQWIDRGLAAYHGTKSASFSEANRQSQLWRRNLACSAAPFSWYSNPRNIRVDATICESGDIFVRASTPENQHFIEWVEINRLVGGQSGGGGSLIPEAQAATISTRFGPARVVSARAGAGARLLRANYQQTATVVCHRFIDQRQLLQHVRTPRGCFDEVIDTLNGTVVRRTAVPCRTGC